MAYTAPENIYWLFSSSAQSIAALIGFLTAGFYFVLGKIDDQVLRDTTLDEINQELKRSHFKKIKILCLLTGVSIILSLLLVFLNSWDYCLKTPLIILVSLINILTIAWAIIFVISIINPDNIVKTAQKLISEDKELFGTETSFDIKSIKIGDFIEKFVQLERIIRDMDNLYELSYFLNDKYKNFTPLNELFKIMFQRELIDSQTLRDLHEVNKVRNLAAHGQIDRVDIRIGNLLDDLLFKFRNKIENKN